MTTGNDITFFDASTDGRSVTHLAEEKENHLTAEITSIFVVNFSSNEGMLSFGRITAWFTVTTAAVSHEAPPTVMSSVCHLHLFLIDAQIPGISGLLTNKRRNEARETTKHNKKLICMHAIHS